MSPVKSSSVSRPLVGSHLSPVAECVPSSAQLPPQLLAEWLSSSRQRRERSRVFIQGITDYLKTVYASRASLDVDAHRARCVPLVAAQVVGACTPLVLGRCKTAAAAPSSPPARLLRPRPVELDDNARARTPPRSSTTTNRARPLAARRQTASSSREGTFASHRASSSPRDLAGATLLDAITSIFTAPRRPASP